MNLALAPATPLPWPEPKLSPFAGKMLGGFGLRAVWHFWFRMTSVFQLRGHWVLTLAAWGRLTWRQIHAELEQNLKGVLSKWSKFDLVRAKLPKPEILSWTMPNFTSFGVPLLRVISKLYNVLFQSCTMYLHSGRMLNLCHFFTRNGVTWRLAILKCHFKTRYRRFSENLLEDVTLGWSGLYNFFLNTRPRPHIWCIF